MHVNRIRTPRLALINPQQCSFLAEVDVRSSPIFADATRLWCVMEVFICIRVKNIVADSAKLASQLLAIKLLENGVDVTRSLLHFDAAKAQCRYDRDRQKLLAVIEASFGTTAPFNQLVIEVFRVQFRSLREASHHSVADRPGSLFKKQSSSMNADVDVQVLMQV